MAPFQEFILYMPLVVLTAYLLDLALGDPVSLPHPVRWIGRFIKFIEEALRRHGRTDSVAGAALALTVVGTVFVITSALLYGAARYSTTLYFIISVFFVWSALSIKSLGKEAGGVIGKLRGGDIRAARLALSKIVGRDTGALDAGSIRRAVVETVSENTSDGIVAPLFYLAIGGPLGPALAVTYKAVNTLDSMVGYKNERYGSLGRFSARLDDWANYVPARMTALLMVVASMVLLLDYKTSFEVLKRDGGAHPSPNAGRPQAAVAGALGIRLGGSASYGGVERDKPFMGRTGTDHEGAVGELEVVSTLKVMHLTSFLMLVVTLIVHMGIRLILID